MRCRLRLGAPYLYEKWPMTTMSYDIVTYM